MTVILRRLLICTPRERVPPGLIVQSVIKQAITLTLYNMNTVHFLKKKRHYTSERRALTNNITSSTQKPGTWLALI